MVIIPPWRKPEQIEYPGWVSGRSSSFQWRAWRTYAVSEREVLAQGQKGSPVPWPWWWTTERFQYTIISGERRWNMAGRWNYGTFRNRFIAARVPTARQLLSVRRDSGLSWTSCLPCKLENYSNESTEGDEDDQGRSVEFSTGPSCIFRRLINATRRTVFYERLRSLLNISAWVSTVGGRPPPPRRIKEKKKKEKLRTDRFNSGITRDYYLHAVKVSPCNGSALRRFTGCNYKEVPLGDASNSVECSRLFIEVSWSAWKKLNRATIM